MKKIIFLIAIALVTASCESFLEEDPKGQFMVDSYFKTVADLETALNEISYESHEYYYEGKCLNMACRGDDLTASNYTVLERFQQQDDEQYVASPWNNCYKTIKQCNNVILQADKVTGDEAQLKTILGIAHFYRGWAYFNLVRWFDKLPLILNNEPNLDVKAVDQATIYEQIVKDIEAAETLLPVSWEGNYKALTAPNVATAKAALAEVYLSMAGYPLKKGTEYYAKAAAKAKEVINGPYGVDFDTYENIFNTNDPRTNLNKERLLTFVYYNPSTSRNALIQCFMPAEYSGWNWFAAERTFFREFPEGPRKEMTFYTTIHKDATTSISWDDPTRTFPAPHYRKMMLNSEMDFSQPWTNSAWRYEGIIFALRFTQTALTYAEAIARSSGPDNLAYELMDKIRTRAELPLYDRGLNGSDFARLVVQERAWELAGEFTRWQDLCRLEMVEEVFAKRASDEVISNADCGVPNKSNYYLPIPASEKVLNPNLE